MLGLLMSSMRSGVPLFDVLDSIDTTAVGSAARVRDTSMVLLLLTMAYRGGSGAREELASFIGPQLVDARGGVSEFGVLLSTASVGELRAAVGLDARVKRRHSVNAVVGTGTACDAVPGSNDDDAETGIEGTSTDLTFILWLLELLLARGCASHVAKGDTVVALSLLLQGAAVSRATNEESVTRVHALLRTLFQHARRASVDEVAAIVAAGSWLHSEVEAFARREAAVLLRCGVYSRNAQDAAALSWAVEALRLRDTNIVAQLRRMLADGPRNVAELTTLWGSATSGPWDIGGASIGQFAQRHTGDFAVSGGGADGGCDGAGRMIALRRAPSHLVAAGRRVTFAEPLPCVCVGLDFWLDFTVAPSVPVTDVHWIGLFRVEDGEAETSMFVTVTPRARRDGLPWLASFGPRAPGLYQFRCTALPARPPQVG